MTDDVAQLGDRDACGLRKAGRLTCRRERHEMHQVASELRAGARADRAQQAHPGGEVRQHGAGPLGRLVGAAEHDCERALCRAHRPARDRRVDDVNADRRSGGSQLLCRRGADGGMDRDHLTGRWRREQLANHVAHLVVVADDDAHHRRFPTDLGDVGGGRRTLRHEGCTRLGAHVEHHEAVRIGEQALRHRESDVAQSDESCGGHATPFHD